MSTAAKDIRCLRVDIHQAADRTWGWDITKGKRMLAISARSYGSKAAACKAFYEVQDYLANARVFVEGKEIL